MALKADEYGFLLGEKQRVKATDDQRAYAIVQAIKGDTAKLVAALRYPAKTGGSRSPAIRLDDRQLEKLSRVVRRGEGARKSAMPVRDERGRFVKKLPLPEPVAAKPKQSKQEVDELYERREKAQQKVRDMQAVSSSAPSEARDKPVAESDAARREAASRERDGSGRFKSSNENGDAGTQKSEFDDVTRAIADGFSSAGDDMQDLDPVVAAANETKALASNVVGVAKGVSATVAGAGAAAKAVVGMGKRGIGLGVGAIRALTGRKDPALPVHKRILRELQTISGDGKKSRGMGMMVFMAITTILGFMAKIPSLLMGLPSLLARLLLGGGLMKAVGLIGGLVKGAGGLLMRGGAAALGGIKKAGGVVLDGGKAAAKRAGGMASKASTVGGGILKKAPLIGGLVGAGMMAHAVMRADDPNLSAAENRKSRFSDAGGGAGAAIGTALGAFGGPVGMIIGGMVGEAVGSKVGDWLSTFDWAAIGQSISSTWQTATNFVQSSWASSLSWLGGVWGGAITSITSAFDSITKSAGERFDAIGKWFKELWSPVASVFNAVGKWLGEKLGAPIKAAKAVVESAKAGALTAMDSIKSFGGKAMEKLSGRAGERRDAMMKEMDASGIKDPKERAMFMAQVDHESGGFTSTTESLKYRSADQIMKVSATARKAGKPAVEAAMAKGEAGVAELMYGGRMGNDKAGDGFKYRGRGAIQLTGKANYAAASKDLGIDLMSNPDMVANDPAVSAKVAAWYWKKNNLGAAARTGDVTAVTKKINGGTNGLDDRKEKYAEYLASGTASKGAPSAAIAVPTALAAASAPKTSTTAAMASPLFAVPPVVSSIASAATPAPTMPTAKASQVVAMENVTASATPKTLAPVSSKKDGGKTVVNMRPTVGQNVADRGISQVATGGIGST